MPDPQHLFNTEYRKGSRPTEADESEVEPSSSQTVATPPASSTPLELVIKSSSQTIAVPSVSSPPLEHAIETKVYGTGKPRRVRIRGKISRE